MLWLSSAVAHAEPVEVAAAKTLWNAQLAEINSKTTSALRDTFDDSAYVILPGSELHADSYNLAKFADHWFLDLGTYKVTSLKIGDLRDNKLGCGSSPSWSTTWISGRQRALRMVRHPASFARRRSSLSHRRSFRGKSRGGNRRAGS